MTARTGLAPDCLHLCIDMQRLFGPEGPWALSWMTRILGRVERLVRHDPERTIFTRFIPPTEAEEMPGTWQAYFEKWPEVTRDRLDPDLLRLLPELETFCPPARLFDKPVYSPWQDGRLHALLQAEGISRLIISGGETDICVLATAMGAIDRGYAVTLAADALCSARDATHDAAIRIFRSRFSVQVEVADVDEILIRHGHG